MILRTPLFLGLFFLYLNLSSDTPIIYTSKALDKSLPILYWQQWHLIIKHHLIKNTSIQKESNKKIIPTGMPNKLALIIAIGNYQESVTGWKPLNSLNDLRLIKMALLHQNFPEKNIAILTDAACTKSGIVSMIQTRLLNQAKVGDIIFLHYSGHGQQIYDDNGDEKDGYDEALVPIDAPYNFKKKKYTGEKHLRDDEFGELLTQLREKVGLAGEVIFTIDACHAGGATREVFTFPNSILSPDENDLDIEETNNRGSEKEMNGFLERVPVFKKAPFLSPFVVYCSSSYDEVASETFDDQNKPVGALSYAFSQSFSSASNKTTYRVLFEKIKQIMASKVPKQTPQIEGEVDRLILGGK